MRPQLVAALAFALGPCALADSKQNAKWTDVKPHGKDKDDAPYLVKALKSNARVRVPKGTTLNIATAMNTTGLFGTHLRLEGTLRVKPDFAYWAGNAFVVPYQKNSAIWLFGGENIVLDGGGTIDGSGQSWWDARPSNVSLIPPLTLVVHQAHNARISNITFYKTPKWANLVQESSDVVYEYITVNSVSNSTADMRETDGWDTYRSDGITIRDSVIHNGDDCVSFKPNSTNIVVRNLQCTESHGISVGSLGEIPGVQDIVRNIYVDNIWMSKSENGTFAGQNRGYGVVDNVIYTNFHNIDNDYPITIDNCYKTSVANCTAYPSGIKINNVFLRNITGTSSGKYNSTVASLVCSPGACGSVYLQDINISAASYTCLNLNVTGPSAGLFNCTTGDVIGSPYPPA
ncbi:Glycosyl hydrolases family 28 [Rhizoctonia solani]|uniref:galacturonan 1,4-alpha-galacturonidase n=1 Tax=Rhizoctonia solani TaxID=456999 RepID=A0A8H7ILM5_9AGAM|nr:Glycosyl hydrolases family 28 [Rhizoctonia solani]